VRRGFLVPILVLSACAPGSRRAPATRRDSGTVSGARPDSGTGAAQHLATASPPPDSVGRPPLACAAESRIPTKPADTTDYYPWIRELSSGPAKWQDESESDASAGQMNRVAVLVSEIFNTVLLEELTFGDEGCCATIRRVRELDLEAFVRRFGFQGEISGFQLGPWLGPDAIQFSFKERRFRLDGLGRDTVCVSALDAP
jgi:hypothetical protein